jgi:hypothetical protein
MSMKNFYSRLALWLIGFFSLWNIFHLKTFQRPDAIRHDMLSYYAYLPAYFIHHDLTLSFAADTDPFRYNWSSDAKNGKVLKMTMGVALLNAPFFLTADTISRVFLLPRDGYTPLYFFFISLGAVFYFLWGLRLLRKILLEFSDDHSALLTILLLAFATNLYYYTFDEFAMSHVYSFFLYSLFFRSLLLWKKQTGFFRSLTLGISGGLLVLIRPIHAVAIILPLMYLLWEGKQRRREDLKYLLIALFAAALCLFPQLLYWHQLSGSWLFYSYGDERFFFTDPKIWEGLAGFRKGWLIYTPVMAFALAGFIPLYRLSPKWCITLLVFSAVYIYVVFSWWCWWYGGSFGARPMIDILPLMAVPLAAFIHAVKSRYTFSFRLILVPAGLFFILLNLFQIRQYRSTLLHWDGMNAELYQKIFLKRTFPENYDKLVRSPDYEAAKQGKRD